MHAITAIEGFCDKRRNNTVVILRRVINQIRDRDIKKLCDPILSQPDLAILHTDFNTVVTGILSENEEIDCTVTNGFSVFFVFIPSYDDGRLFHAATPDIPPAHPATSPRNRRYTTGQRPPRLFDR